MQYKNNIKVYKYNKFAVVRTNDVIFLYIVSHYSFLSINYNNSKFLKLT